MYATEEQRNRVSILRLQNACFKHAMLLKLLIQGQLKSLTSRKFFGSYYLSLTKHAPEKHRIVSGRTSNTEKEEATFNSIKLATNFASNHHLNKIITNALIRLQEKDALNENQTTPERESKITKMYGSIKGNFKNTVTSFHWVKKYKRQYRCLLKSIADYLTDEGKWWKEVEDGVKFFDVDNIPHNSKLLVSHFRSTAIRRERTEVSSCWISAIQQMHTQIPGYSIEVDENQQQVVFLQTLDYFKTLGKTREMKTDLGKSIKSTRSSMMLVTSIGTSRPCNILDSPNALSQRSHGSNNNSSTCSTQQYIDFTNDTSDISFTDNIAANNAKKHPHATSTPVSKRNESEEVISFIPNLPVGKTAQDKYSKSSAKLMKLFGNSEFLKRFDIARKNVIKTKVYQISLYIKQRWLKLKSN